MKKHHLILVIMLAATATLTAQTAQRYYWVGGGANNNWGTLANWSSTSGGTPAAGITTAPANVNTVIFDQNSFLSGDTVIIIDGAVQCDSLIVQNCTRLPLFNIGGNHANNITINGSMFLQKGTMFVNTYLVYTYNTIIYLKFTSTRIQETIATDTLFNIYGTIQFSGSNTTVWKLANYTNFYYLNVQSGTFDLNGKNIDAYGVTISGTGGIAFANSTIDCSTSWNNSVNNNITAPQSANSFIRIGSGDFYGGNGNIYYNVEFYGNTTHSISTGTYNKLNVLRGKASIYDITTDTLLLQGGRDYSIYSVSVNNYLWAKPLGCGGNLRLFGDANHTLPMLTLGSNATVDIQNALIHDLAVSKPITAVKSYDWGNNTNISFTSPDAGRDMYWTGGSGSWDDPTHWRLANGSPANCTPTLADNVFFDNTSSSGTAFQVNVDTAAAYCNSMTWSNVPATSYLYIYEYNSLYINGSLTLSNTMSFYSPFYNSFLYFTSDSSNNTITSNGCPIYVYNIYFQSVSGNGKWKIQDDLLTVYAIYFNRGHLDLSGYNVAASYFVANADGVVSSFSSNSPLRTLNFYNSTITLNYDWQYIGGQQITSTHSANSLIKVNNNCLSKGNDYYYNVEHTGIYYGNNYCVGNDTSYFNKITFNSSGAINCSANSKIYPDSLLLLGNGNYMICYDLNVRKYLGTSQVCGGNTIIRSSDNMVKTIYIDTVNSKTDRVKIRNTSITDVSITNGNYDVTDCTVSPNSMGWNNINNPSETYYWVGGTGNWSDIQHWANTSGGIPGSGCIPRPVDNVIFDDNSGFVNQWGSGGTVTVDVLAYCDSMLWIGADSLHPNFYLQNNVTINGSLELQRNMTCYGTNNVTFIFVSTRSNETIKTNGVAINVYSFNGTGSWTLLDSLVATIINFYSGTLNFNGQYVDICQFNGSSGDRNNRFLNIKNSEIHSEHYHVYNFWNYTGDLLADSSIIYTPIMVAEQTPQYTAQYNDVVLNHPTSSTIYYGKYNKITVLSPASINQIETDTLILSAASNYVYQFYDTLRVNKGYYGMGTPCKQIYLQSANETVPAIFDIKTACANFSNDTLLIDNVYVHGIKVLTGSGNAKLKKGSQSPDVNNAGASWGYGLGSNNYNQDWAAMLPYNSGGSTYFGEDRIVPCGGLPDTLYSDNFLPSYGAIFEWRKDSLNSPIIHSSPTYIVTDSGRYYLTVNYGNDCKVTDDINFTILSTDSISETICYGETYSGWNLTDLDTAGFYISRYITSSGCDSLVYLTLSIRPQVDTTIINAQICEGNTYQLNGFNETDDGFYSRTTPNINGCDSVIHLYLSYYPAIDTTFINGFICQGSYYTQNGFNENTEGTHYLTVPSINGCDSVLELTLSFTDLFTDTIYAVICQGDTYNLNDFNENEEGTHQRLTQTAEGCDSLTTLILSINPVDITPLNATICEGDTYDFFGQNLTDSGTYKHILQNQYGCDSIIELVLNVNPVTTTPIAASICQDTSYYFAGKNLSIEGVYYDTLQDINGCDSIIELTLSIDPLVSDFEIITAGILCEDDHIELTAMINDVTYKWNTGEISRSIRVSAEDTYSVEVMSGQCQAEKEITVTCPCKMFVPNFFSPNGDGMNDEYLPQTDIELQSFQMIIYNRWGIEVFRTNKFMGWDGKSNGKDVSAGVYFCLIEYYSKQNPTKKCTTQSSITLVR